MWKMCVYYGHSGVHEMWMFRMAFGLCYPDTNYDFLFTHDRYTHIHAPLKYTRNIYTHWEYIYIYYQRQCWVHRCRYSCQWSEFRMCTKETQCIKLERERKWIAIATLFILKVAFIVIQLNTHLINTDVQRFQHALVSTRLKRYVVYIYAIRPSSIRDYRKIKSN